MSAELDAAGARDAVTDLHLQFVGLNRRFTSAGTDWQIRPTQLDRMALNDHTERRRGRTGADT